MQELHNSIEPGDMVLTIGGVIGKVVRKEAEYLTLVIDEEKDVTMKIVLYAVNQKIENRGARLSGLRVSCSCLDPLPDLDNANVGTIRSHCRRCTCFGVPPF